MQRHGLVRRGETRLRRTIATVTSLALLPLALVGLTATDAAAVGSATATLTLTSATNPAGAGRFVTFTLTAAGGGASGPGGGATPTGAVELDDGFGGAVTQLDLNFLDPSGSITFTYPHFGAVGNHPITARYAGDGNYAVATSNQVIETITGDTVSGQVKSALDGSGISGSQVWALEDNGAGFLPTQADSQGNYVLVLSAGAWTIWAGSGFGGPFLKAKTSVTVTAGQSVTGQDFSLRAPVPMAPGASFDTQIGGHQDGNTGNGLPTLNYELIQFTTTQCANGSVTLNIDTAEQGGAVPPITVAESPSGSGTYSVQIDGLTVFSGPPVHHGDAVFTLTVTCPGAAPVTASWDGYIDPSGTVVDTAGDPIFGATVTLLHASTFSGTYTAVPNGSAVMSPSNRVNPWTTGSDGAYAWDVIPGFYKVRATAPDCSTVTSEGFAIPPEVTDLTLTLTCAPGAGPTVRRFAGTDRIGTAVIVSQGSFPTDHAADAVVLARSNAFADALASGPLAAALGGPLLLTSTASLDGRVRAEVARVLPAGGTVDIVGGVGAVSDDVKASLVSAGFTVRRIAGDDRYATAAAVADAVVAAMAAPAQAVLLATGVEFPDGLVAGAAAANVNGVVLLTNASTMPAATSAWLDAHPGIDVFAVGGPAVAAAPAADGIAGNDRYATATMVASRFFTDPNLVGVVSGIAFPDALVGAGRLGATGAPLVLSEPASLSSATRAYLSDLDPRAGHFEIYGGTGALSATIDSTLATLAA